MLKKSIRAMTEIVHWLWMSKLRIPFPASTAGTSEVQADHAYADKNRKYKNVSHQNGLSFSPLIFESTGRIKSTIAILRSFAKLAEEPLRIPNFTVTSSEEFHAACNGALLVQFSPALAQLRGEFPRQPEIHTTLVMNLF